MNKRSARPHAAGKSGGPLSLSHAVEGFPLGGTAEDFAEQVKNTPGLPEACIQLSQMEYDELVESGLASPAELQEAEAMLAALHAELREIMVRQKLYELAKELMASKKMARNPQVEMRRMKYRLMTFKEIQDLAQQMSEVMRSNFDVLMDQVEVELSVRAERFLEKTMGVEEARRAMGRKKGDKSLYQKRQQARRIEASMTHTLGRRK